MICQTSRSATLRHDNLNQDATYRGQRIDGQLLSVHQMNQSSKLCCGQRLSACRLCILALSLSVAFAASSVALPRVLPAGLTGQPPGPGPLRAAGSDPPAVF